MNKSKRLVSVLALSLGVSTMAFAGPTVYVPLGSANAISIIDAGRGKITGRIGNVASPHGLAVTPDGKTLVTGANVELPAGGASIPPKPAGMSEAEHRAHHSMPAPGQSKKAGKSYVSLIDIGSQKVIYRIEVKGAVHHNTVTPDGRYAIATHGATGSISVIDLNKRKTVKSLPTGPLPNYAIATRDGKSIYVSNAGNGTISEVDTRHWIVRRNILAGPMPEHMVLSPDEQTLYVSNVSAGTVSVVSLKNGEIVKRYTVGTDPHGLDLSDDGRTLFATSRKTNTLVAIDLGNGNMRKLTLAPAPYHVTSVRGTRDLYVSSREKPRLWVIDEQTLKVKRTIELPAGEGHQMVVVE